MNRDDRTKAQKLRDAFLLHALFLEGVRNWQKSLFKPTAAAIAVAIRKILSDMRMNFKDVTRKQIVKLVRLIRNVLYAELSNFKAVMLQQLQIFMGKDVDVFQIILSSITGIPFSQAGGDWSSAYGPKAANGTKDGNALLWAAILNLPMAATGLTVVQTIDGFNDFATAQILKAVNIAYADNSDTTALEASLFSDENDTTSVLDRIGDAASGAGSTAFGFVSSQANIAVSSVYFQQYQWCSVVDSRTTEICQSRNDNIYTYGEGPEPPAHINCRSTIIPYDADNGDADTSQSFTNWVDGLPQELQDELFSQTAQNANQINPINAKLLSVDEFDSKASAMLR